MFFRRRAAPPADEPAGDIFGYQKVTALVAVPDVRSIARERALNYQIGVGLQGYAGQAIGYDRGAPEMTLTAVMQPHTTPTASLADIGRHADGSTAPTPEVTDLVMSDPALDPYQAMLWARLSR